jgi:hypothetical protein
VLTGQYNQHRTSTNSNAVHLGELADATNYSTFGLAYLYPVTHNGAGKNHEPVIAQPLYITSVSVPGAPSGFCNNSTTCNMLLVATLSDYVYAFDTSTPPGSGPNYNYLWPPINLLSSGHCQNAGVFNNKASLNGFPGVANLPYYGVVATPAVDTAVPSDPTAFVVSACIDTKNAPTTIQWFLDAIDLTSGTVVATQALTDSVGTFNSSNQIARPSLLLTHPTSTSTYVHVTFGNGVREIGAETGSGGPTYRYTGAEFALQVTYPSTISAPIQPVFYTTCMNGTTTNCAWSALTFPSVFTGTDGNNYPTGPAGGTGSTCTLPAPGGSTANNCSPGGNWAVNGGGCWMSSRGPASSANADVILACGNGAFACGTSGSGQTSCTNATSGTYWGQSAIQLTKANANNGVASATISASSGITASGASGTQCLLTFNGAGGSPAGQALVTLPLPTGSTPQPLIITTPGGTTTGYSSAPTSATASSHTNGTGTATCSGSNVTISSVVGPVIPKDFFAPNKQTYTCANPPCTPSWDPSPSLYQTQELSRVDQDFGTGGVVVMAEATGVNFVATADKAGFVYLMPPPSGEVSASSLGGFQANDAGLNGSGLSYTTQPAFRASRLPTDTTICPSVDANGTLSGNGCDEVHELAFESHDNLMFVWPSNETVVGYKGSYTAGGSGTPTNFHFGSGIDPCSGATHCTNFPAADQSSAGGAMAVAVDSTTTNAPSCSTLPCIELWSIVPQSGLGTLYVYNVPSSGNLKYLWDSSAQACSSPPVTSWFPTAFTEPTLADNQQTKNSVTTTYGAVYVPTVCGATSGSPTSCGNAGSNAASGVLVYTHCPS